MSIKNFIPNSFTIHFKNQFNENFDVNNKIIPLIKLDFNNNNNNKDKISTDFIINNNNYKIYIMKCELGEIKLYILIYIYL